MPPNQLAKPLKFNSISYKIMNSKLPAPLQPVGNPNTTLSARCHTRLLAVEPRVLFSQSLAADIRSQSIAAPAPRRSIQ